MGAGGRMSAKERVEQDSLRTKSGREDPSDPFIRVPTEKPPFTLSQLKKAIPTHCFERSIRRSFSYLFNDLLISGGLFYLAVSIFPTLPPPFHLIAWPLYWFAQGCILTGVWVIAHECGHHAFSDYAILDNIVGFILHSFLLVPFFSFKYSHRHHHSNAGSLDRDEVYVPKVRSSVPWSPRYANNPFGRILTIAGALTLGWPMYLMFNLYGRPYERFASHFDPYSPIFNDNERAQVFISDASIIAVLYLLYRLAIAFSISWVLRIYGVPLLIVNAWLILITFLQHTHTALPRYDSSEWDWLRGALATVDRDYGFLNRVFHNINNTHVAHHLFSTMPHYHAMEATKAIRPVLGDYYRLDTTPVVKALWREARECHYVESEQDMGKPKGVYWYHNVYSEARTAGCWRWGKRIKLCVPLGLIGGFQEP